MITSIAGVTIVINTLTCTLIIRYLLYAPCMGKRAPLLSEGSGEAFPFRGGWGGFIHNHKITITKSQKGFSMCKKGFLYNIIPY